MEYRCVFTVAFQCREGDAIAELELMLPFAPFVDLNVAGLLQDPWGSEARVESVTWVPATEVFRVAYNAPIGGTDIFDRLSAFDDLRPIFLGCGWRWSGLPEKANAKATRK
jgi:hypothetical protein